ncbi:MAG TPA: PIG-L family deacetylase [Bryocella sp.]|nr:PIG-L family deacetylase [Bryocella sp.]
MHRFAPVALATILAATAQTRAQAQDGTQPRAQAPTPFTVPPATGHFTDPANLAGERPRPRDGRELPIDGGLSADGKPDNALGLAQMLRRLNTRASLMLIVAHPDDEDGGMLTYYSRGLGARVAILTLNRGEGGQNQMTGDFEDALGLLRTQELLSADRYMGVTQMFGTEVDFGFTKTKQEAFQKWNHQRVLYDAVRAVRIFRPLIIASTFEGAVTDGHGQHQVSGEIAQEVFKAAGDPTVFPELTREGILPWEPLKVYARVPFSRVSAQGLFDYATGQTVPAEFTNYVTGQKFTTEPTADVTINEGATDPLLTTCSANLSDLPRSLSLLSSREAGSASPATAAKDCTPLSYVQFARIGLGLQRSQIGGGMRLPRPGRSDVSYHLYGSRVCAPNLPNPTPNLCTTSSTTATNNQEPGWPTLSRTGVPGERSLLDGVASERVGYRAAREKRSSAHLMPTSFTPAPSENPELARAPSFFDGIDTSLEGIASLAPSAPPLFRQHLNSLANVLSSISSQFDPATPAKTAPALADASAQLNRIIDTIDDLPGSNDARQNIRHELLVKRAQIDDALALALGLSFDATTSPADLDTGTPVRISARISETAPIELTVKDVHIQVGETGRSNPVEEKHLDRPLASDHPDQRTLTIPANETENPTRPYFFRNSIEDPVYQLTVRSLRNAPATPPAAIAWAHLDYRGVPIDIGRVLHSGDQPVQFTPPINLSLSAHAQALPLTAHSINFYAEVRTNSDVGARTKLQFAVPDGWTVKPRSTTLHPGQTTVAVFPPSSATTPVMLSAVAHTRDNDHITEGFRPIGYGNLPRTNFYTPATLRVVPVDLKLPPENKRRIAYLPGTGDDVPAALASIGLTPTILKVSDLTAANLSKYDTVILGVRTYNAHPDLHGAPTQALLDFARNGGNVVVQTQTPEFTAADAPYPLTDRNERVIDETAPVVLLDPGVAAGFSPRNGTAENDRALALGLALLTTPNKITPADFNNWIEERGHGFLDTWDPHYTALTEVHDPGAPSEHIRPQAPQRGGLITVQLGKGRWTYCAFALYRQLPEAVPGAFRLFVNLLNP